MDVKFKGMVDDIGRNILRELQKNGRATFSEIGRTVGLSSPAVAERVYKMEAAGIILGYRADITPHLEGETITAFITVTTRSGKYSDIFSFAEKEKQIRECHHISGNESLIFKVTSPSIPHLDDLIERLGKYGETKTSIVLSSPIFKTSLEWV